MLAYHSDPALKERILAQLAQHRAADEIIKGQYWEGGKGCAVGCTIYSGDHAEYEPRFGIPEALARLEDQIFEVLPNAAAKFWPERFMAAIRPGADLSRVHWQFLHWLLTVELAPVVEAHADVQAVVLRCAAVLEAPMRGEPIDQHEAVAAAEAAAEAAAAAAQAAAAAEAAAWAAAAAAWAAWAAKEAAEAAWAAAEAAKEAAEAAWAAAWAAEAAAWAASAAARAAWAAAAAADAAWAAQAAVAARAASYQRQADKLIALLEAA